MTSVISWESNRLDIFGLADAGNVLHKWWDGSQWVPGLLDWQSLGGSFTSQTPTAVASWGTNRLDIFSGGGGGDAAMYHKWLDGSNWHPGLSNWENLGGVFSPTEVNIASPAGVASWGSNRLDIFAVGSDRAMYHKWWDGSNWGPGLLDWQNLGGSFTSSPVVVSWGSNRLDIFALGSKGALCHKWWDGSKWGPGLLDWQTLNVQFIGPPAVVSWGSNRLDLFGVVANRDIYHVWWDGSRWGSQPVSANANFAVAPPAVASWASNRLDIFALGMDSVMYHKWWDGSNWGPGLSDWQALGDSLIGPPAVASWGRNRLDIVAMGRDHAMYHKWWDGSWGPGLLGWQRLGGAFGEVQVVT